MGIHDNDEGPASRRPFIVRLIADPDRDARSGLAIRYRA